jgi:RimJ/RimL family protein N-acetyltransferase
MSIPFPYTPADAQDWFASQETIRAAGHGLDFAVIDAHNGRLLGAIGIGKIDALLMTAEIGYWLARAARGHGYMSRAVRRDSLIYGLLPGELM